MTNTKFRKRALLSSVAMLIVALIALGSATFAWYQANLDVSSTGMTFTTNAASGLEVISASVVDGSSKIQSTDAELTAKTASYGSSTTFANLNTELQPASLNPAANSNQGAFFTTTGTDAATSTIKNGATVSTSTSYVEEFVYFKIANAGTTENGTVALTNVTITAGSDTTADDMADAIRVVVYKMDGTIAGEFAITGGENKSCLLTTGTYTTATASTFIGTKTVTTAGACNIPVGSVTKSCLASQGCRVRVYLDGFENSVFSNKATAIGALESADQILSQISLGFTMTPSA
jgi:hypothetical protein